MLRRFPYECQAYTWVCSVIPLPCTTPPPGRRGKPSRGKNRIMAPSYAPDANHGKMPALPGTLYVVATPIGNLEDLTLRAVRVLREVALIACEDTRRTSRLLQAHQISTPTTSFFEHNERWKGSGSWASSAKVVTSRSCPMPEHLGSPIPASVSSATHARKGWPWCRCRERARWWRPCPSPDFPRTASSSWGSCPRGPTRGGRPSRTWRGNARRSSSTRPLRAWWRPSPT